MNQLKKHTLRRTVGDQNEHQVNWSQISETLTLLALAIAQIDHSIQDGNESVGTLTSSFTKIANNTHTLTRFFEQQDESLPDEIHNAIHTIGAETQKAIMAFQFYDRLSQRMEHVEENLERMGHLISDPQERYKAHAWKSLQELIKGSYTMEAERLMFDYILAGHSISEALEIYHSHFSASEQHKEQEEDDIELFWTLC